MHDLAFVLQSVHSSRDGRPLLHTIFSQWDTALSYLWYRPICPPIVDAHTNRNTILHPKMNCGVGLVNCFLWVPLACHGSMAEGSRAGTSGELWKNSLPNLLHSWFWDVVYKMLFNFAPWSFSWDGLRESCSRRSQLLLVATQKDIPLPW